MKIIDICYTDDPAQVIPLAPAELRRNPAFVVVPPDADVLALTRGPLRKRRADDVLIVAVDADERVVGVCHPGTYLDRIRVHKGRRFERFEDAVEAMEKDPEEAARGYHHEYLNLQRPNLVWCQNGLHLSDTDPCPEHA